jgi:hypothetical protein
MPMTESLSRQAPNYNMENPKTANKKKTLIGSVEESIQEIEKSIKLLNPKKRNLRF